MGDPVALSENPCQHRTSDFFLEPYTEGLLTGEGGGGEEPSISTLIFLILNNFKLTEKLQG